jgi:hypothetical protein
MRITIHGRVPSKKNSVVMFVRNGKLFKMPSNAYREWHKGASQQIKILKDTSYFGGIMTPEKWTVPYEKINSIEIRMFAPDRRKADLTNKAESILDLLVDNHIIADDNWFVVPFVLLNFAGVDKVNPRVEIIIQ